MLCCAKCDKDCTNAYHAAPPSFPYRCACGSAEFVERPDPPKVTWKLSANDKKMLKRHERRIRNAHDD